jgi:hypothetical protein
MNKLTVKMGFNCLGNKEEVQEELNKIILYQIYEKIINIDAKGVELKVTEGENE